MEKNIKLIWWLDAAIVLMLLYLLYLLGDGRHFLFPYLYDLKNVYCLLILLIVLFLFKGFFQKDKITIFGFTPESIYENKLAVVIILGVTLFISKFPTFTILPFSDSAGYIVPASQNILGRNFDPVTIPFWDIGHPPLLMELIALSWKIFGKSVWASHIPIIISAFISVYFLYLIGKHIYSSKIGFWAALLFLVNSLFFSQSGRIQMEVPLTAAVILSVWAFLSRRYLFYFYCRKCICIIKRNGCPYFAFIGFVSDSSNR